MINIRNQFIKITILFSILFNLSDPAIARRMNVTILNHTSYTLWFYECNDYARSPNKETIAPGESMILYYDTSYYLEKSFTCWVGTEREYHAPNGSPAKNCRYFIDNNKGNFGSIAGSGLNCDARERRGDNYWISIYP